MASSCMPALQKQNETNKTLEIHIQKQKEEPNMFVEGNTQSFQNGHSAQIDLAIQGDLNKNPQ